jgi:hypothetical protein
VDTKHKTTAEERQWCWDFAGRLERVLANPKSDGNAAAAALTSHGINRKTQTLAKLAEITFCKWARLDYRQVLDWYGEPDKGTDVVFAGKRWDVKHTEHGSYLLWPYNKVHTLELGNSIKTKKNFNAFALVIGGPYEQEIVGWCTREFFENNYQRACAEFDILPWLTDGTLILRREQLRDMNDAA